MNAKTYPSDHAAAWWLGMRPYLTDDITPNPYADRAGLAHLRRASVAQAMCEPATFALLTRLGGGKRDLERAALCAAVLASVKKNDRGNHPARALGPLPGGDAATALLSVLRFRRLIEATESEDRLIALRRAVALAKGILNVRWLAGACLDWSETTRRDWIFRYYNAASAAPEPIEPRETAAEEPDA